MALELRGEFYIRIDINGIELPLTPDSLLDCLLIENNLQALPTFSFIYKDLTGLLTGNDLLVDGALITVQIGKDKEKYEIPNRQFRLLGQPQHQSVPGGSLYKINAVLNAPQWLHTMPHKPLLGTSTKVLQTIAANCGMQFKGDNSLDNQTWYPSRKSYAMWAHKICDAGWFGDDGCSVLGVGLDNTLHYRNLATAPFNTIKASFDVDISRKAPESEVHQIRQSQIVSNATLSNHVGGYPMTQHSVNLDGSVNEPKNVQVKRVSKTTVNTGVAKQIGQTRTQYAPPECGNTHNNYQKAIYQNKRLRSLWSTAVYVVVDTQTSLTLFDPVEVALHQYEKDDYARFSGRYIVGARTLFIRGNRYGEKIEFVSQGPTSGDALA